MTQYRKYFTRRCKTCGKKSKIRNDYIKQHTGFCQSCRKKEDWKNPEYRKKCSESHKGFKVSEKTKRKISKKLKGKMPKNLEMIQRLGRKPKGMASARHLFNTYRASAKRRKREFALSFETFIEITQKDCFYCGQKPSMKRKPHDKVNGEYVHNGVDRIDNEIGYIENNCVPCCTKCNYAKRKMSVEDFYQWAKRVVDTIGSRTETSK